tara:strand:+ start:119 stop:295 length:177 start_codon:yes stop_codon:yes gene_type:complete
MLRERAIMELSEIREKRIAEMVDDEEAKQEIIIIVNKFLEDLGFPDVAMSVVEAWQEW